MTRIISLFTFLLATLGLTQAATTQEEPSPGTYTCTAEAKIDNPGSLTVSSNGGEISTVVVKLNGDLLVEGTGYTKVINGSRVTINIIQPAVDQADEVEVSGQCATSGTHEGEIHNSPNWKAV